MNCETRFSLHHHLFFTACLPLLFLASSCTYFKKQSDENPVARVYDQYLYAEELRSVIPSGASKEDSMQLAATYINNWIKQHLLVRKAELNLPEEKKDVQKQLDDYRNSLILFLYQEELVKQRLDTTVRQTEIETYYEANKQNFALKENIVRAVYVKLDKQNKAVNKIRKWLNDADADSKNKLNEYCSTQALQFSLDEYKWFKPEELAKETGIAQNRIEQMARNTTVYELEENDGYFIVKILEYQLKDDISPLSFEQNTIRNIILNKRKLQLIEQLEKDVMNEGATKKNFEIYTPKKN
ncbi:MAG: hypothetical protein POELPBGB_02732 [Bacteroidia bacterium]|nr:hypothetical protein [Bacteroidia bacterium]